MEIRFQFNLAKALHAMTFIVDRLGATDKVKLIKLLYIADRDHFIQHGYPITGDRQCAMKHGPVPSACLDALNGQAWPNADAAFEFLHVSDSKVMLKEKPAEDWLEPIEKATLERVLREYGATNTWALRDQTHQYPEFTDCYVEGTSKTIPYESILKHYKGDAGFRNGRVVVPEATAAHMVYPFTAESDADL